MRKTVRVLIGTAAITLSAAGCDKSVSPQVVEAGYLPVPAPATPTVSRSVRATAFDTAAAARAESVAVLEVLRQAPARDRETLAAALTGTSDFRVVGARSASQAEAVSRVYGLSADIENARSSTPAARNTRTITAAVVLATDSRTDVRAAVIRRAASPQNIIVLRGHDATAADLIRAVAALQQSARRDPVIEATDRVLALALHDTNTQAPKTASQRDRAAHTWERLQRAEEGTIPGIATGRILRLIVPAR